MDWWTAVHFASGYLLARIGLGIVTALFILVAFEIFESWLRHAGPEGKGLLEHESTANIAVDIGAGLAGFLFGAE